MMGKGFERGGKTVGLCIRVLCGVGGRWYNRRVRCTIDCGKRAAATGTRFDLLASRQAATIRAGGVEEDWLNVECVTRRALAMRARADEQTVHAEAFRQPSNMPPPPPHTLTHIHTCTHTSVRARACALHLSVVRHMPLWPAVPGQRPMRMAMRMITPPCAHATMCFAIWCRVC